jgi:hypothetical protein
MQKVAIHPAYLVPDYHAVILSLPRVSSAQPPSLRSLFSKVPSLMASFQNPLPSRVLSLMSCYYEVPSQMASYSLYTSLDNNKSKHNMEPVYSSYSHTGRVGGDILPLPEQTSQDCSSLTLSTLSMMGLPRHTPL